MEINSFFLREKVYHLNDFTRSRNAYIGGFNNQSLIELVRKNKAAYVENGILMLEGGVVFTAYGKEFGGIPIYDDLASLYAYYLNALEEYIDNGFSAFFS
ncbi:hypothetical protein J32TS6_41750 [Virgibacillus pantothenticus]|uniref:Uncharacterized protein n=1 Tax=Virgibacillus pantothenticus TaxID=1473 RepID=A0A0L0QVP4_VIRPA|nr:hypothetical protein [Virgibacillus pantothenticus]KNE22631.1 hypothetical protein AFK71_00275 [Virgibacillus pantothenticus]MBU8601938.1 hypothetical protein [Virgibacillus pantothenticus]MBU8635041.1 hypothetical protein [Virgibacillus pantothenticus]MBU8642870.1 hypothetical protein [Virgibacillus pantothenticus]MBU8660441.1 hypothetical protein [Virgibacillus pantothenticus]